MKTYISHFSCPNNLDVQYFLQRKAIEFAKQSIANTFLVFGSYKSEVGLLGYFTISQKSFDIPNKKISRNLKDRIKRFGTYIKENDCYSIPAPLIGQLGKNFTNGYNNAITGDELLELACDKVGKALEILGGKIVYLECEDISQLTSFYERNGFKKFGDRELDSNEVGLMKSKRMLQYLKVL